MRIRITFKNGAKFDWHMYGNDFVNRWIQLMHDHIQGVPSKHDYELTGVTQSNIVDVYDTVTEPAELTY